MSRCISLAKNGLGTTYPNPLVGSVIVYNNKVIGEGWHYKAGHPHAEVNAINQALLFIQKNQLEETLVFNKATLYVSLEPCSHWGKTPPCADLITAKGIKNVVIGSTDPNPKVAGRGIIKLTTSGCNVTLGVLEMQCNSINKRFFTFQNKKRPYILLKWAETADGFIAPESKNEKKPVWISNEISRQLAHKMRAEEQALLVGTKTVLDDNPSLSTRDWKGDSPTRIVIDKDLRIEANNTIFDQKSKTLIINCLKNDKEANTQWICIDFNQPIIPQICNELYQHHIQSMIIEGGATTLQQFIDCNVWDEAIVYRGKQLFKKGLKAPIFKGQELKSTQIGTDTFTIYTNTTA